MGCPDCLDRNERIAWRDSRIAELEREVARLTRECEDQHRMQLAMRAKATEACSAAGGRNERVAELTSTSKRMREERDHYRSKYLETQRQLDEARALVEAATCFIFEGPSGRQTYASGTPLANPGDRIWHAGSYDDDDDIRCDTRDEAIAMARALAKEGGK